MADTSNKIWDGDRLGRMREAMLLEKFLLGELATLKRRSDEQSYVLAIDAAYGEGKSWFLDRFHSHLSRNHPVAFVDAWVDDANDEPVVAIMAAIEDALKEFLAPGSIAANKFKAASRAALPVIGKAFAGGAAKFAQRYLGDAIFEEAGDELRKALDRDDDTDQQTAIEDAIEASIEKAGEAVSTLLDKQAAQMIADYRKRQKSRTAFKANMASLVTDINEGEGDLTAPLFVIVDELDRCRPDYAIKVLEEIKHFFDVPNVVFVIALHGDQLTKSIGAVYGSKFDSESYLRRFFSRRYELRRLSVTEIVTQEYLESQLQDEKFFAPQILSSPNSYSAPTVPEFIGAALDDMSVTPRESFPVMDGLRLFHDQWIHKVPIELVALLPMLVNVVRGKQILAPPETKKFLKLRGNRSGYDGGIASVEFDDAAASFPAQMGNPLHKLSVQNGGGGSGYAFERFADEYRIEHNNSHISNQPPKSLVNTYADVVRLLERLTDDVADQYLSSAESKS